MEAAAERARNHVRDAGLLQPLDHAPQKILLTHHSRPLPFGAEQGEQSLAERQAEDLPTNFLLRVSRMAVAHAVRNELPQVVAQREGEPGPASGPQPTQDRELDPGGLERRVARE